MTVVFKNEEWKKKWRKWKKWGKEIERHLTKNIWVEYRFLLNRNVNQFIFIFFKECFFTHSVTSIVHSVD